MVWIRLQNGIWNSRGLMFEMLATNGHECIFLFKFVSFVPNSPDLGIDLVMSTDMYRNDFFILDKKFNSQAVAQSY